MRQKGGGGILGMAKNDQKEEKLSPAIYLPLIQGNLGQSLHFLSPPAPEMALARKFLV
jgi:hypothetical protein